MALASATTASEVTNSLSPNTMYYLALYFLVILVRFFKLKKEVNLDEKFDYRKVFHVGLELVYTASGLVVLLLNDLKDYAAFIVIGYLIIVIVSSQIETMDDRFSLNSVFITHFVILLLVLGTTYWYFEYVEPRSRLAIKVAKSPHHYRVAIPYQDYALREYIGNSLGKRQFVYIAEVEAADEITARKNAIASFKVDVLPFESKRRKTTVEDVTFIQEQIIAKPID